VAKYTTYRLFQKSEWESAVENMTQALVQSLRDHGMSDGDLASLFPAEAGVAERDEAFDWVAEIHETVEHEVKHHLEWLAGEDALGDVDAVMEQDFRRGDGRDFDPAYYQWGEEISPGIFVAEEVVFLEQSWAAEAFARVREVSFRLQCRSYRIPRPERLGDVHFVRVHGGGERIARLELVLVRERSWWEDAKRLFGSSRLEVLQSEAEILDPDPDAGDRG